MPEARPEAAGEVPRKPLRRMVERTGARQRGCVEVAVGVGEELFVEDGVGVEVSVVDEVEVEVREEEGVAVLVRDSELLGVPVRDDELLDVSVRDDELLDVPVELAVIEGLCVTDDELVEE